MVIKGVGWLNEKSTQKEKGEEEEEKRILHNHKKRVRTVFYQF